LIALFVEEKNSPSEQMHPSGVDFKVDGQAIVLYTLQLHILFIKSFYKPT